MAEPMRALTIKPPWSHAITHGTKRVENRSWPAPAWAIGQDIAIHAGKGFDWGAEFPPGFMAEWAAPQDCALGAVVAVARLAGCHDSPGVLRADAASGVRAASALLPVGHSLPVALGAGRRTPAG